MESKRMVARICAFTHRGAVRARNEDTIAVEAWVRSVSMKRPHTVSLPLEPGVLCLVADGMGGHAVGHIASDLAARSIIAAKDSLKDAADVPAVIASANEAIYRAMDERSEWVGMGTTVAGLLLREDTVFWFNVGDSPIFSFDSGFLRQRSIDDYADGHHQGLDARSHAITQSLGGTPTPVALHANAGTEKAAPRLGNRYLLCSDGLTDMLSLGAIETAFEEDDVRTTESLFTHAMNAGGGDNISMILVTLALAAD